MCVELLQRGNDCSLNKPEDEQSQPDASELEQREQKQPREQQQQQFLVGTRRHVPQVLTHSHGFIYKKGLEVVCVFLESDKIRCMTSPREVRRQQRHL